MALKGFSFTSLTKYIRDLVAGIAAFTAIKCKGNITASGNVNTTGGVLTSRGRVDNIELHGNYHSFMTADKGACYACTNAYWDGTWKKFDNSKVSNIITVNSSGELRDSLVLYHSQAGDDNPIRGGYHVYHTGFKPNLSDVGGGQLSSDLSFRSNPTNNDAMDIVWFNKDNAEVGRLWLNDNGGHEDSLTWRKSGAGATRKIYHEGFRPATENAGSNDTDYPVGTILLVGYSNTNSVRNGLVDVVNHSDRPYLYIAYDAGKYNGVGKLSGTWRQRGQGFGNGGDAYGWHTYILVQRVA